MVPQQQVPGILAAQADAASVLEISGTVPAQRMAVWGGEGGTQKAQGLVTTPKGRRDGNYPRCSADIRRAAQRQDTPGKETFGACTNGAFEVFSK